MTLFSLALRLYCHLLPTIPQHQHPIFISIQANLKLLRCRINLTAQFRVFDLVSTLRIQPMSKIGKAARFPHGRRVDVRLVDRKE